MRRTWPLGLLVAALLLAGCSLKQDSGDCVTDPGLTQGGSQICSKPPPPQFSQLGQ